MHESIAGKLLVAMPSIGDSRFTRAVILLCLHDEEQAMGLIVNKPKPGYNLGEVLGSLGFEAGDSIAPRQVLDGGPVTPDRGFVLHSEDFHVAGGTRDVAPGVRLTATREVLEAIVEEEGPEEFIFALGYSGWGPGQLEQELSNNVWLVAEPEHAIVYGKDHPQKWAGALKRLGLDPAQLSAVGGSA